MGAVAFKDCGQRLPGVRVHGFIPPGEVVHGGASGGVTHLVPGDPVGAWRAGGAEAGEGCGGGGGESGVQRPQGHGFLQVGGVGSVGLKQLLAEPVNHDHANIAETVRVCPGFAQPFGQCQRVAAGVP